jgi:hypothetical protein
MTSRELRATLESMDPEHDMVVVLFTHEGTSEVFALEEVLSDMDTRGSRSMRQKTPRTQAVREARRKR